MSHEEIDRLTEKIYPHVKTIPGIDKNFIRKCLLGISSLGDPEVEERIKLLSILL